MLFWKCNKKDYKLTISVPEIFSRPRLFALEELLSLSLLILSTGNTDDILSLTNKKMGIVMFRLKKSIQCNVITAFLTRCLA